jgi:chromosome segregation ATPase
MLPPEAQAWVVGVLVAGVLSVFGFLVRRAFGDVTDGLSEVRECLDELKKQLAAHDTHRATLELRVGAVERELSGVRERYHELVNTVTARLGVCESRLETTRERLRHIELRHHGGEEET